MRRILGAPLASLALALAVPGVALAARHGRRHHHATSHFSSHHRHGKHLLRFGSASTPTSPTAPATPTSGENAGTVESFENGVLTVKLADRSMVKGKVAEDTDLRCVPATPPSGSTGDDDQGDGDHQGLGHPAIRPPVRLTSSPQTKPAKIRATTTRVRRKPAPPNCSRPGRRSARPSSS
jgi:hypothetical protein